jgi:CCR4-NOT transcription complex subunit 9
MLNNQHVFSHQQQQPPYQGDSSWQQHIHQQQQPPHGQGPQHLPHHGQHPQAQAAAAVAAASAAQAAQQQHYNRIAVGNGGANGVIGGPGAGSFLGQDDRLSGAGIHNGGGPAQSMQEGPGMQQEERRILDWMAQLLNTSSRESALLELSKKREQFPTLALILWHSFGMCAVL